MTIKEILAIEKASDIAIAQYYCNPWPEGHGNRLENDAPEHCINLFKEGIFWRMYQKSAYAFTRQIKILKVMKKLFKVVNCEVVYAGFPDTILSQIEALSISKGFTFKKCTEKQYRISGIAEDVGFEEWKNSIELKSLPGPLEPGLKRNENLSFIPYGIFSQQASSALPCPILPGSLGHRIIDNVIEKLKRYSLANHNPIETMQLVMDLQNELAAIPLLVVSHQQVSGSMLVENTNIGEQASN